MMRKPAPLRRGDLVAVVAPAGAIDDLDLNAGVRVLETSGFRVRLGASVRNRNGYFAGTDRERAADIHAMFRDPEVRGILTARGGYGSGRILPLLDPEIVRAYPKIFVGHSDVTCLLNDFVQRAGMVTFHGPMVAGLPHRPEITVPFLAMLRGERIGWHQTAEAVIQPGTAEGVIVGGCLSLIVSQLGTPFGMETRGRLLFLEDVNEKPYRIDRMLTQMRQAGLFDEVAGVIFGDMIGCGDPAGERVSVCDVISEVFATADYPVAYGLPSGHGRGTVTLPLGVRARLAGERLTLLESPLSDPRQEGR